jgi:hypothetical protein
MNASTIIERLRRPLRRMHRDESGAIVVLCFAGCLFLFAVSLIVYDAGGLSRDKIDAQMAADTAGYSQAAVKARSMNMIAFANVGKRTISGIRNMYFTQYPHYMDWYSGQCSRCCCFPCGCWGACLNCLGNTISLVPILEGIDYIFFMLGRFVGDDLTDYLEDLDSYQEEMAEFADYWGLAEGIIRGVRNGANSVTAYPLPDTDEYGGLPVDQDSGFFAALESCLAPTVVFNASSLGTLLEWKTNFDVLEDNSVSRPPPASQGPAERVNIAHSYEGCFMMLPIFADARAAVPYYLTADGDDGEDYMKKSNIVFAYRHNPEYMGQLRDNYDAVLSQDYSTSNMLLPEAGLWAMARSEIYYPESNDPALNKGIGMHHDMWMFHPSWVGKLRPVALKDEELPVDPSDMWSESRDVAFRQAPMFGVDMGNMMQDLGFMEKATRGMDGQIDGKEVLDGVSK